MNYVKRIVCLANSRKPPSGRCIAGKEISENAYGPWIRPVSARPSAEVSEEERRYENGRDPRLLDIIDVPMVKAAPSLHQAENHMIDGDYYWAKTGELTWAELGRAVDRPATLWANGDSTQNGLNDRVSLEAARDVITSLVLIRPASLSIQVQTEGAAFGNPRRRVRADFRYLQTDYLLVVTDPVAERAFLAKPDARYRFDEEAYLCVSLAAPYTDNYCYKLAAGVIIKELL